MKIKNESLGQNHVKKPYPRQIGGHHGPSVLPLSTFFIFYFFGLGWVGHGPGLNRGPFHAHP